MLPRRCFPGRARLRQQQPGAKSHCARLSASAGHRRVPSALLEPRQTCLCSSRPQAPGPGTDVSYCVRAQAAIQLQLKLQGSSQHRGIDLAVVDCTCVPCRSSAFDCVLDKARFQRRRLLHSAQPGLINGVQMWPLVDCLRVCTVAVPSTARWTASSALPQSSKKFLCAILEADGMHWCRAHWTRWTVQAVPQTLCMRLHGCGTSERFLRESV